ncbi:MAG: hypothetical protein ACI9HK_003108, partial [Pirellulaceae bacterium]
NEIFVLRITFEQLLKKSEIFAIGAAHYHGHQHHHHGHQR